MTSGIALVSGLVGGAGWQWAGRRDLADRFGWWAWLVVFAAGTSFLPGAELDDQALDSLMVAIGVVAGAVLDEKFHRRREKAGMMSRP